MLFPVLICAILAGVLSTSVEEINDYVDIVLSELSRQILTPYRPTDSFNKTVMGRPEIWAYFGDIAITGYEHLQRDDDCKYFEEPSITRIVIHCNLTAKELKVDITGSLKHSTYPPRGIRASGLFPNSKIAMTIAAEPWKEINVTARLKLSVPEINVVNLGEEAKYNSIRLGYRHEIIHIMQSSQHDLAKELKKAADAEVIPF